VLVASTLYLGYYSYIVKISKRRFDRNPRAAPSFQGHEKNVATEMASTKDKVKTVLSEVRMLVLGAQILLGFQYQALFRPGFEKLPGYAKTLEAATLAAMLVALACLIAPSSFHRISENGDSTERQHAYAKAMLLAALVPFALAIGANIVIAMNAYLGTRAAILLGIAMAAVALFFWFGITLMEREKSQQPSGEEGDEKASLKEKISELLTEARIILPGAQALLGFQFAAYLTESFEKLSPAAKAVHTASLLLVALAMILLMTPAPYHRIVEDGDHTERFDRLGVRFVLAALVPLALGLAGVFYVVLDKVSENPALALAGALAVVVGALALWFGVPLIARERKDARSRPA
jgi:H+/gluconate symporter-like permease